MFALTADPFLTPLGADLLLLVPFRKVQAGQRARPLLALQPGSGVRQLNAERCSRIFLPLLEKEVGPPSHGGSESLPLGSLEGSRALL